ncbi:hypothetical protein [Azospirillum sp.]|uniref:hypothetical protein n=1 Tax=Azospirillum sp. TaxID=34012 RepID=UPI003D713449
MVTFAGTEVKAELYREANEFCARQAKHMLPLGSASRDSAPFQYATAEITFRCLRDGDPDLRPGRAPDMVIETRAR